MDFLVSHILSSGKFTPTCTKKADFSQVVSCEIIFASAVKYNMTLFLGFLFIAPKRC